jgi:hypothetical protein
MKLKIERPYLEAMVKRFPHLSELQAQLTFGNSAEISLLHLQREEAAYLCNLFEDAGPAMQARAVHLSTLRRALNDEGPRFDNDDLERLVPAIARYFATDALRGWLFTAQIADRPLAFVVTRLDYTPPGDEETGKVLLELKANSRGRVVVANIRIYASDIVNRTVPEVFAAKGFLKETPELIRLYDATAERYFDYRARYGEQFSGQGMGLFAENPTATHRDTDWSRKDRVVLSASGGTARLVNDESILADRTVAMEAPGDILGPYLRRAAKSSRFRAEDEVEDSRQAIPKGLFTRLPVHFYILMFHLDLHHYVWVHVDDVAPYSYQPELKDKLVLPAEHTELIDILTAEMDLLMDDIVAGKSGGTTVLCAGPPGVGKTLTAEVYSEIIRRPLYRVHSGQLGLNVAAMEATLKEVLTRAQRWGAIMLIDEADVYIKRREDDMAMNAVVGVFLRVLEYFNGLLFLTTNRVDDIDEAIVSRCIALIRFYPPDEDARRKIWKVMTAQFGLAVSDAAIDDLVRSFPTASGRDIKGLSKLVATYCNQKRVQPSLDAFRLCSVFRGLEIDRQEAGSP